MKNYKLFTALFLGATTFLYSQEKMVLTMDQAVQMGIQNSKNLKIDEAKIEEATANYIEAKNRKLPDFKLSLSGMALTNAKVKIDLLPPGNGNSPKANSLFLGQANFSMPLFAGGRVKYGIQSANYLVEAQKLSAENDKTAIAYNVSQAYNNLYKAGQTITLLQENLKAAQERDKHFLNLENNGIIARNDRLKANLQTSTIELQLMDAINNYGIANINMDLLLGLPESTKIEIDPNYISENLESDDVNYYVGQAMQNRKDVQSLAYERKAAALVTKAAKAEALPTVALTAGYISAEIPNIMSVYLAANIGLGIQYNLANIWKKNSAKIQSEAREKQLSATNDLVDDQIKLEVNRDYLNSGLAKKKIAVYQKAKEQADENYRVTKNKFDNGLATMTELLDADAAQIVANINMANAKADASLAYKKLLQTTGILINSEPSS